MVIEFNLDLDTCVAADVSWISKFPGKLENKLDFSSSSLLAAVVKLILRARYDLVMLTFCARVDEQEILICGRTVYRIDEEKLPGREKLIWRCFRRMNLFYLNLLRVPLSRHHVFIAHGSVQHVRASNLEASLSLVPGMPRIGWSFNAVRCCVVTPVICCFFLLPVFVIFMADGSSISEIWGGWATLLAAVGPVINLTIVICCLYCVRRCIVSAIQCVQSD